MFLKKPTDSLTELRRIGVAICRTGIMQLHVGLIFRTESSNACHILHFPFDGQFSPLQVDSLPDGHNFWISENEQVIPDELSLALSAGFSAIAKSAKNIRLPFSPNLDASKFNSVTLSLEPVDENSGVTCATFCLKLFEDLGLPLIDESTWPAADEDDVKWFKKMSSCSSQAGLHDCHFRIERLLKSEFILKRFKPEDLVSAFYKFSGNSVVEYADIADLAQCVKKSMTSNEVAIRG